MEFYLKNAGYKHRIGAFNTKKHIGDVINLILGKADWNAFQLLVVSEAHLPVTLDEYPMFSKYGDSTGIRIEVQLPYEGLTAKIHPIGFVEADHQQKVAEVILNEKHCYLDETFGQMFWIEIVSDQGVEPGHYAGKVVIYQNQWFSDEVVLKSLDFTMEIKDYVMPKLQEAAVHMDLWQHNCNIARKHEVSYYSEAHFQILEKYIATLAELGQKCITIIASEIPWIGQKSFLTYNQYIDLYEYNMIKVSKEAGVLNYDYSVMDRYIALCTQYGIDKEIEIFGLINVWQDEEYGVTTPLVDYPDYTRVRYYDKDLGKYCYMQTEAEIGAYIQDLFKHLVDQGLEKIVRIVADEPHDKEAFRRSIEKLKQYIPQIKIKAAINELGFIDEFSAILEDVVPALYISLAQQKELEAAKVKYGVRVLTYVCCGPDFPNTFVKSFASESRALLLLCAMMGSEGLLRWSYTAWTEDPRQSIAYRAPIWPAGDMMLVYPDKGGDVCLSTRWKYLKKGIEDYVVVNQLKGKMDITQLLRAVIYPEDLDAINQASQIESVINVDYETYEQLRGVILDQLIVLKNNEEVEM